MNISGLTRIFKDLLGHSPSKIRKAGLILLLGLGIIVTGCGRNPIAPVDDPDFTESLSYDSEFDFFQDEEDDLMNPSSAFSLGYWGKKEITVNDQGWITIR
ncbi:MAG: hypothetical protein AB1797_13180 [bacterium]